MNIKNQTKPNQTKLFFASFMMTCVLQVDHAGQVLLAVTGQPLAGVSATLSNYCVNNSNSSPILAYLNEHEEFEPCPIAQ